MKSLVLIFLILVEQKDPAILYNLGVSYLKRGMHSEAIKCFKEAVSLKPDFFEAWRELGTAYSLIEDYKNAVNALKKAKELNPKDLATVYNLGVCYSNLKEYDNAIKCFNTVVTKEPDNVSAWYNLGVTYMQKGAKMSAVNAFKKVTELEPSNENAWYSLGVLYYQMKDYDKAIEGFLKVLEINPENVSALSNISVVYSLKGDYKSAIKYLERATQLSPDNPDIWYNLGACYLNENMVDKAILAFKKAVELKPDYTEAWKSLGAAYDRKGQFDEAIYAYKKAMEITGEEIKIESKREEAEEKMDRLEKTTAEMFFARAKQLEEEGKLEDAETYYDIALVWYPDFVDAKIKLKEVREKIKRMKKMRLKEKAREYEEKGDYVNALREYKKALEIDTTDKALKLKVEEMNTKLSVKDAKKSALEHFTKGLTYFSQDEFLLAIREWEKALKLDPRLDVARECIKKGRERIKIEVENRIKNAEKLFKKGKYKKALIEVEKGLKYEPQNANLLEMKKKIEEKIRELIDKYLIEGEELLKKERYVDAESKFRKILYYNPRHRKALQMVKAIEKKREILKKEYLREYYIRGIEAYAHEDYEEAIFWWEKVLQIDPNFEKARRNIERAKFYLSKEK